MTASDLIGRRIEIPVHYDMWARGARFGVVTKRGKAPEGYSEFVYVKMDHPQARRRVRVWKLDYEYCKVL